MPILDGMLRESQTRRRLLRRTGELAVGGAVAGVPGCSGSLLGSGPLSPQAWVAEPGLFTDRDHASYAHYRPSHIMANRDKLSDSMAGVFDGSVGRTGVAGLRDQDVTSQVVYPGVLVVRSDVEEGKAVDNLQRNGYDEAGDQAGFTVWLPGEDSVRTDDAVGIDGRTAVFGSERGGAGPRAVLEAAIAVGERGENRYADHSQHMDTLMGRLGTGDVTVGRTMPPGGGRFDATRASGLKWTFDGETSTIERVFVFADADAAERDAVAGWLDGARDGASEWGAVEDPEIDERGNSIAVRGTMPTDEFVWGWG
jgi:hypothetical protein